MVPMAPLCPRPQPCRIVRVVDWGACFDNVRLLVRLRVDVRSIDRRAALRLADARQLDVDRLRDGARNAIASYIRILLAVTFGSALALRLLVALALRGRPPPRLRWTFATAVVTSLAIVVAIGLLLPPRGTLDDPEYYAHGPDIPCALTALQAATESAGDLSDELNSQLVGLARFVSAPAGRRDLGALPTLTTSWLRPLRSQVDVVMVHSPALTALAARALRDDPPSNEIAFVVGHTHRAAVERAENLRRVNGGTAGGGGTGNLDERQPVGLAVLTYEARPFRPLAVDLVEIDPGSGSARAERRRLAD